MIIYILAVLAHAQIPDDETFLAKENKVKILDDFNFDYEVNPKYQTENTAWLIYFYLIDCQVCEGYDELWQELATRTEEFKEKVKIGKVCIDYSPLVSNKLKVDRAPLLFYVTEGYLHQVEAPRMADYFFHFINSKSYKFSRANKLPLVDNEAKGSNSNLQMFGGCLFAFVCLLTYRYVKTKRIKRSD
jgi:hypothetical protein